VRECPNDQAHTYDANTTSQRRVSRHHVLLLALTARCGHRTSSSAIGGRPAVPERWRPYVLCGHWGRVPIAPQHSNFNLCWYRCRTQTVGRMNCKSCGANVPIGNKLCSQRGSYAC